MTSSCDVLIVDDDDDLRTTFVETLEDEGIRVASAKNGQEALERLRAGRPAVILLDYSMPVMDARAFRAAQRADPAIADVPVVLMSASRCFDVAGEVLPHVTKPLRLDSVIELVKRYSTGTPRSSRRPQ
jgi:CheY-like chemotaxis protein